MSASGGSILAKMKDGFRMHPQARVFHARGQVEFAPGPGGVLVERPSAQAPAGAFGGPFRIGGAGVLQAGGGAFETLTSGSSGQPRRIVRSCASWAASFAVNAGLFGIAPGVREQRRRCYMCRRVRPHSWPDLTHAAPRALGCVASTGCTACVRVCACARAVIVV